MPTCDSCGFKESGRYFKNKRCPKCDEKQFPNIKSSKDKPVLFTDEPILDNYEKEVNNYNGLLGVSANLPLPQTSETIPEMDSYSIPSLDKLEAIQTKEDFETVLLTSSEWKVLTIEIYLTIESMLKKLNPEFYNSPTAQNLRDLNAKLTAIVLSAKRVNPLKILILTNFLYIIPAFKGLAKKKDKEEKEEIEESPKVEKKKVDSKNPNDEFYKR